MSNSAFTPTVLTIPATGGGGTGQGELSTISNSSAVTDTTGWTNVTRVTSNSPLNPLTPTAFSISNAAGAESSTSGGYASFTLPTGLQNRKLKVEFYYTTPATDVYRVSVYKGSTRVALSTDSSGATTLPANTTGKFVAYFDTDNSASWSLNVTRTSGTTGPCYITNVVCGPGIQPQGAVVGEWQKYADADVALYGSTTNPTVSYTRKDGYYRRVGDSLEIQLNYLVSAWSSGSGSLYVGLPAGLTIDGTKLKASGNSDGTVGTASWYDTSAAVTILCSARVSTFSSVNRITLWANNTGGELQISQFGTDQLSVKCTVPIAEWAGSGTVQLAQNDVEYAADNGSQDIFGPSGAAIPSIAQGTGTTVRTLNFTGPRQQGDSYALELQFNSSGAWTPAASATPWIVGGSGWRYGAEFYDDGTSFSVTFGNGGTVPNGAFTGNGASAWNTGWKWRVRKTSAGAAVGFGIVSPGTSAGLVSAAGLPGNTTGNPIASGYVGERIFANSSGSVTWSAAATYYNVASISLPPGIWAVSGTVVFFSSTATGITRLIAAISTSSTTADVTNQNNIASLTGASWNMVSGAEAFVATPTRYMITTTLPTTPVYLLGFINYASNSGGFTSQSYIQAIRLA